ncbi:MAG: hypothetical protein JWQ63_1827 [Mucilaginibacter sp.]|jgi:hypothetical protein|nr:hypothetical protein [Mucilaginibacter sp.]
MDYVNKLCKALLSIQDKYFDFFSREQRTITDYIHIDWNYPISIIFHDNPTLPIEIKNDLEKVLK